MTNTARRRALLIGVPEYWDETIPSFPDVVTEDISRLSVSLNSSGYQVAYLGIDNERELTLNKIRTAIKDFLDHAHDGETTLVYFDGHGLHEKGKDYFVPVDWDMRVPDEIDYDDSLVRLDFADVVESSRASTVVFFVDACRQGVGGKGLANNIGWSIAKRRKVANQCYVMVFACGPGQLAQYVRRPEPFSLFGRSLAEVLDREHPARTIADVLESTQVRLTTLTQALKKQRQDMGIRFETTLDRNDVLQRPLCNGSSEPTVVEEYEATDELGVATHDAIFRMAMDELATARGEYRRWRKAHDITCLSQLVQLKKEAESLVTSGSQDEHAMIRRLVERLICAWKSESPPLRSDVVRIGRFLWQLIRLIEIFRTCKSITGDEGAAALMGLSTNAFFAQLEALELNVSDLTARATIASLIRKSPRINHAVRRFLEMSEPI